MIQKFLDLYQFNKNPVKFCNRDHDFIFELNGKQIYCTSNKDLIEKVGGVSTDLFDRSTIAGILGTNLITETQSRIDSLKLKRIFIRTIQRLQLPETFELRSGFINGKELIDDYLIRLIGAVFSNYSSYFPTVYSNWLNTISSELLFVPQFRNRFFPSWRKFQKVQKEIEEATSNLINSPNSFPNLFNKVALEEGIYLSNREIVDNSLLFLFGSFDNVSITAANVFVRFNLEFRHDRLNDFLNDLDYHIEDALRSKPPIPFIPKTLNETFEYKGQLFFNGETIGVIPTAINRKMFGVGKRKCPGEELTFKLVRMILNRILPKYKLIGKVKNKRQRFSYGPKEFAIKEL